VVLFFLDCTPPSAAINHLGRSYPVLNFLSPPTTTRLRSKPQTIPKVHIRIPPFLLSSHRAQNHDTSTTADPKRRHFMSLAQHVSAVEGVDQDFADDIASLRLSRQPSLQINYDPIPPGLGSGLNQEAVVEKLENLPAYEVSTGLRIGGFIRAPAKRTKN